MKITCVSAQGREVQTDLRSLLTPELREAARLEANRWIKRLRLVRYGTATMRERFTYRGESLWWFTELYLHKMRRLDRAVSVALALDAARRWYEPTRIILSDADVVTAEVTTAFGVTFGMHVDLRGGQPRPRSTAWASYLIGLTARLSRWRPAGHASPTRRHAIAAFVHTAFWNALDAQQESYIGPVLETLTQRSAPGDVFLVGVGPRRNFRARRWWDPLTPSPGAGSLVTPVERLAPHGALDESFTLWRGRHALARDLTAGDDVRAAAVFRGCDLWPVLRRELENAALVQWPWSARAMDQAGAALDALQPHVVLTYAEAGGWGRALVLEARRRGVRSVGLQHGFIYRHWLNYLHEPDEMCPIGRDAGFPRPDRTLVYDRLAAEHLEQTGRFPASSLGVTGSARQDDLAARLAALRPERQNLRRRLGVGDVHMLAVLTAKFIEINDDLPALIDAVSALPDARLIIKPHPAETAAVYAPSVAGRPNVWIAPSDADLASLLAAADGVVTMNSTVAIDGLGLGLPALVIGLPNNLSPFVSAGVMLGADGPEKIRQGLEALLYDREVRHQLAEAAEPFVRRYGLAPDGRAAHRAADEILSLLQT